jgi:hypothetical protein
VAGDAVNAASRRATAASARWVAWRRAKARGSTEGRVTERARARAGRSLPASVTRPISSAGTSSPAASETPRTTRVGQPARAAKDSTTEDSMSTATAPVRAWSAALAATVATSSLEVASVPERACGASAAARV